jgi:hypothetical protein
MIQRQQEAPSPRITFDKLHNLIFFMNNAPSNAADDPPAQAAVAPFRSPRRAGLSIWSAYTQGLLLFRSGVLRKITGLAQFN